MTDPIASIWVQQYRDAAPLDAQALTRADARFRRRIAIRDAVEYVAGLLGAGAFAYMAMHIPDWGIRIGAAAIILGTAVMMRNLWRRRPAAPDTEIGTTSIAFHRAQLVGQRDALSSVWRWYIAPVVPGMAIFMLAVLHLGAQHLPFWQALLGTGLASLPVVAIFWGVHHLNRIAARRFQAMIDALDQSQA